MMMSPESYFDKHFKGASVVEIDARLHVLRDEIREHTYKAEAPLVISGDCSNFDDLDTVHPGHDVYAQCLRDYFWYAYNQLISKGIEISLTDEELAEKEFNDHAAHAYALVLHIQPALGLDYTYMLGKADGCCMAVEVSDVDNEILHAYSSDSFLGSEGLAELLRNVHMGAWKKAYLPSDYEVCVADGERWTLTVHFDDGYGPCVYSGHSMYPFSFDRLMLSLYDDCDAEEEQRCKAAYRMATKVLDYLKANSFDEKLCLCDAIAMAYETEPDSLDSKNLYEGFPLPVYVVAYAFSYVRCFAWTRGVSLEFSQEDLMDLRPCTGIPFKVVKINTTQL